MENFILQCVPLRSQIYVTKMPAMSPIGEGGNIMYTYIIAGYPDNLGGHPILTAVGNSTTIYCTPTTGISPGAFIEGHNLEAGTFVDVIYADYFTINQPTLGPVNGYASGGDTPVIVFPPGDPNNPTQTCAGVPDLYERQFNFTDFSTNTPNAQQPGNKLDLELNTIGDIINHIRCRLSQIQRDDGFLRTEMIGLSSIIQQITNARENALIVVAQAATNVDQLGAGYLSNCSVKATEASNSAVSAASSASSAQLMSSSASMSAMSATTSKNQAIIALEECQDILEQLLAVPGPVSLTQANATQAQQSAQAASESETATQGYRSEIQTWHQAIQVYLSQAQSARNGAVSASVAAVGAATGATASAGQASDSASSASVSAAQAANSAAAALAHSLNYIPGPPGVPGNTPFTLRGEYNNGITYNAGDAVTYQGSLYRLNLFIGGAGYNPVAYQDHWFLLAAGGAKGDKGDTGNQGIPGVPGTPGVSDRYKTTSTSSVVLSNHGFRSIIVEPGLSWTIGQSVVLAYDASNHIHGLVTSYDPITGAMTFEAQSHTGSGTYASWTVNLDGAVNQAAGIPDAPSDNWTYERFNGQWLRRVYIAAAGTVLNQYTETASMMDASGSSYDVPYTVTVFADGSGGTYTQNSNYAYPNGYKTSWSTGNEGVISWYVGMSNGTFIWGTQVNYQEYQNGSVISGWSVDTDNYAPGHQFAYFEHDGGYMALIYDGAGQWHQQFQAPADPYGTKYGTPVWQNPDTYETGGWQNIADGSGGSLWVNWDFQAPYPPDGTDWGSYSSSSELYWAVTDGYGYEQASGYYTYESGGCSITWQGTSTTTSCGGWSANVGDYISSGSIYDSADSTYKNYYVTYNGAGSYSVSISY